MCWIGCLLQAPLLKQYPAPISVIAYSYLFGAMIMGVASYFLVHDPSAWIVEWNSDLIAVLYNVSHWPHLIVTNRETDPDFLNVSSI